MLYLVKLSQENVGTSTLKGLPIAQLSGAFPLGLHFLLAHLHLQFLLEADSGAK